MNAVPHAQRGASSCRHTHRARWGVRRALALVLLLIPLAACASVEASARDSEVTYSATVTIPVPPASTYAGSAGGDGWSVALSSDSIYTVFHWPSDALRV